ncbi:hypothetical protein F7Q91_03405 [Vibrio chagasii]|uniref:Recombination-associated protein RdgC n=1 Tax=Vibrio chagasii TaxID=170679 RepID=A0A7V7NX16_9VIBR|nr:recombination-associated protein RdgC [Vibrio chagasii]KAB0482469.1 hypothetical protein F7Q91_03405 [Vibrio chagasii]
MFENLSIYTLPTDFRLNLEDNKDNLIKLSSKPLSGSQDSRLGWISPMNNEDPFVSLERDTLFLVERRYKSVAPSTLKEAINQHILKLAQDSPETWGPKAKVTKAQKKDLSDMVWAALIKQAHTQFSKTYVLVSQELNMVLIGSIKDSHSEDVIDLFRATFKSFPAKPLELNKAANDSFLEWLGENGTPDQFELRDGGLVMESRHNKKNKVSYNSQIMSSDEINANILADKKPTKVELAWDDSLAFCLDSNMKFSKFKLQGILKERIKSSVELGAGGKGDGTLSEVIEKNRLKTMSKCSLTRLSIVSMLKNLLPAMGGYKGTHRTNSDQDKDDVSKLINGFEATT